MTDVISPSSFVAERVDPLPPGRIAMWCFLASDLMFFVGLVGAFIVLRAGNANLFANHVMGLNKGVAGGGALALVISSVAMFAAVRAARNRSIKQCRIALVLTLLAAGAFVGSRLIEYVVALDHHTIVSRQNERDPLSIFDGRFERMSGDFVGYVAPLPPGFDPHVISEADVARIGYPTRFYMPSPDMTSPDIPSTVFEDIRYGPGKNIFYAIWFTLTGAHLVHLIAGMIAIAVLIFQLFRNKALATHIEYVGLFWHFLVAVGVFLFPLLYLL